MEDNNKKEKVHHNLTPCSAALQQESKLFIENQTTKKEI